MTYRNNESDGVSAAKASFSRSTGYRIEADPTLPSQTNLSRGSRRPDPLAGIFDKEVVPILEKTPQIRPIAVFDQLPRNHPLLDPGVRRNLERRMKAWCLQLEPTDRDTLVRMLTHLVTQAGNASLMPPELVQVPAEHAMGNPRILCATAAELLAATAHRDVSVPDEKFYLEHCSARQQFPANLNAKKILMIAVDW